MYILFILIPESHLESVKNAIFATGAGSIGQYKNCAWQTEGRGQFMPLAGSNAHIGEIDKIEHVKEYKVEIVCREEELEGAIQAMKQAHPYETPAYHVVKCEPI